MQFENFFDFKDLEGKTQKQLLSIAENKNADYVLLVKLIIFSNDDLILNKATNTILNDGRSNHPHRKAIYSNLLYVLNHYADESLSKKLFYIIQKFGQDANIDLIKYYEKMPDSELIRYIVTSDLGGPIFNFASKRAAKNESTISKIIDLIDNQASTMNFKKVLINSILKLDDSNESVRTAKMYIACSDFTSVEVLEKMKESSDNNIREMAIINLLSKTNDKTHFPDEKTDPTSNVFQFRKKDEFSSKESKEIKSNENNIDWEAVERKNRENQKRVEQERKKSNDTLKNNIDSQNRW